MLTELPVELLGSIASYGYRTDLFNLRLTSRLLHTSFSDDFDRRFFRDRTHHYSTRSLKLLLEISKSVRTRKAVKRLTIVAVEPLYRDVDALQTPIRPQVIKKRAEQLARQNRHHRSTSKPPPVSDIATFSSEWLALQDSINEQCASMFEEAWLTSREHSSQRCCSCATRLENGTGMDSSSIRPPHWLVS